MKVIISAAGTGGHIYPAIAIANKICEKEKGSEILFIGTNRGLENDLVPRAGYELRTIEAYGLKKEISFLNLKHIFQTISSTKKVRKIIDEFKPDLVLGTGGYICGPVFWVATSKKIPTILHESNAYPGRAVKTFYKKVNKVLVGFEDTKTRLGNANNVVITGTPTKLKKLNISNDKKEKILLDLGIRNDLPVILIFGGSQGSQKINEACIDLIKNKLNDEYQIIWATGQTQYDLVKEEFEKNEISLNSIKNVKVLPYIYNMEELINICDLVICRSGAMTITEISICSKPAIFIPLPSCSSNRQEDNAKVLENLGAAKIILNDELTGKRLSNMINNLIYDKEKLIQMGKNASKIAPSNVEEKIYSEIESVLKSR